MSGPDSYEGTGHADRGTSKETDERYSRDGATLHVCSHALGIPLMRTCLVMGGVPLANQLHRLRSGVEVCTWLVTCRSCDFKSLLCAIAVASGHSC